jgi:glutaminyl-tRNA synthetase
VDAINNPEDASAGSRSVPFSQRLYIERDDFKEDGNRKFFRLKPGGEVRLRGAYIVRCDQVIKDEEGTVTKLQCAVDWDTLNKNPTDRKVKGVIHWVSQAHAVPAQVRLFDRLFAVEKPEADKSRDFIEWINPDSLKEVRAFCEPSLAELPLGSSCQFERIGYFCRDTADEDSAELVFNRTVALRDSWAKRQS